MGGFGVGVVGVVLGGGLPAAAAAAVSALPAAACAACWAFAAFLFAFARGCATASRACVLISGFNRKNQIRASAAIASSAGSSHFGSSASCRNVPSSAIGVSPSGWTATWNGIVFGWPRMNDVVERTRTLTNAALPGGTTTSGGSSAKRRASAGSAGANRIVRSALPRLSTAIS